MLDSAEHSLAGLQMTGKANRGLKLLMQMVTRIRIIMIKKNPGIVLAVLLFYNVADE